MYMLTPTKKVHITENVRCAPFEDVVVYSIAAEQHAIAPVVKLAHEAHFTGQARPHHRYPPRHIVAQLRARLANPLHAIAVAMGGTGCGACVTVLVHVTELVCTRETRRHCTTVARGAKCMIGSMQRQHGHQHQVAETASSCRRRAVQGWRAGAAHHKQLRPRGYTSCVNNQQQSMHQAGLQDTQEG